MHVWVVTVILLLKTNKRLPWSTFRRASSFRNLPYIAFLLTASHVKWYHDRMSTSLNTTSTQLVLRPPLHMSPPRYCLFTYICSFETSACTVCDIWPGYEAGVSMLPNNTFNWCMDRRYELSTTENNKNYPCGCRYIISELNQLSRLNRI